MPEDEGPAAVSPSQKSACPSFRQINADYPAKVPIIQDFILAATVGGTTTRNTCSSSSSSSRNSSSNSSRNSNRSCSGGGGGGGYRSCAAGTGRRYTDMVMKMKSDAPIDRRKAA